MNTLMPRILHVDDTPMIRSLIRSLLRAFDARLDSVAQGGEALVRLRVAPACYACLIVDHRMPQMNGLHLAREARSLGFGGEIVVVSSFVPEEDRAEYACLGVRHIFVKDSSLVLRLPALVTSLVEDADAQTKGESRIPDKTNDA